MQNILSKTPDILLVGPYIKFPDKTSVTVNQSFNTFLNKNFFQIIDYNNYEIVNKSINVLHGRNNEIDSQLSIDLYGWGKNIGLKLARFIKIFLTLMRMPLFIPEVQGPLKVTLRNLFLHMSIMTMTNQIYS